jgi:hypothetical protein
MTRTRTRAHEAGHCLGALLAGARIDVVRVGVDGDSLGSVKLESGGDPFDRLIAIMLGPLASGQPVPAWPPNPAADRGSDEREAAQAVHEGAITRAQYASAAAIAAHYACDARGKEVIARIAHALGTMDRMTDRMVRDALTPELREWIELGNGESEAAA